MTAAELAELAWVQVKATGATAGEVAGALLGQKWASLGEEARKQLAIAGLARLVNDLASDERGRALAEEIRQQWECRRAEEATERATHRADYEERLAREERERKAQREEARRRLCEYLETHTCRQYQEEVERIHAETWCDSTCCRRHFKTRERCIGGPATVCLPDADKERYIAERSAPIRKVEAIHAELHCRKMHCPHSFLNRQKCVWDRVLQYPPERHEECIRRERALNDRADKEQWEFARNLAKIGEDFGYAKAIRNMRSIMLVASDGSMKSLLDFSLQDVRQWRGRAESMAVSWGEREAWFRLAEQALLEAGVDCISQLYPKEIGRLAGEAERIWKKKEDPRASAEYGVGA